MATTFSGSKHKNLCCVKVIAQYSSFLDAKTSRTIVAYCAASSKTNAIKLIIATVAQELNPICE